MEWRYFIFTASRGSKLYYRANEAGCEKLRDGDWVSDHMTDYKGNVWNMLGRCAYGGPWIEVSEEVFFDSYDRYVAEK